MRDVPQHAESQSFGTDVCDASDRDASMCLTGLELAYVTAIGMGVVFHSKSAKQVDLFMDVVYPTA